MKRRICQTFLLPSTHIKIMDLTISRPLTIKGRPGTISEITHGSIVVDFELGSNQNNPEKFKDVFVVCECHIIFGDRANLVLIKEET
jgi:hypothetical protein